MVFYDIQLSDDEITIGESEARKLLNKLKLALGEQDKIEITGKDGVSVTGTHTFEYGDLIRVHVLTKDGRIILDFPTSVFDTMVSVSDYDDRTGR